MLFTSVHLRKEKRQLSLESCPSNEKRLDWHIYMKMTNMILLSSQILDDYSQLSNHNLKIYIFSGSFQLGTYEIISDLIGWFASSRPLKYGLSKQLHFENTFFWIGELSETLCNLKIKMFDT